MRTLYLILAVTLVSLFAQEASAQIISCPTAAARRLTAYTNGQPNDSIFFICGINPVVATTSLVATAPSGGFAPYTFNWQKFNAGTNSWDFLTTQSIVLSPQMLTNVGAGGYRVVVLDAFGQYLGYDVAWVCEIDANPSVSFTNITGSGVTTVNGVSTGCSPILILTGFINPGSITPYYNAPLDYSTPVIIGANTQISACFTGTHTFNSDITFDLVGPPSCGSPVIHFSPYSSSIGQTVNCNGADNFTSLCFSNQSTADFNICTAGGNMTGTYGAYGVAPGTLIDWSALNGCDATATGWQLRVTDCYTTDVGTVLNTSSLTITGPNNVGVPTTITMHPTAASTAIADGSCTQSGAFNPACCVITNVPLSSAASSQTLTQFTFPATYQWTTSGGGTLASPTGSVTTAGNVTTVVNPAPTQDSNFCLQIVGNHPGAVCGGSASACKFYDYIGGQQPTVNLPNTTCVGTPAIALTPSNGTWAGTGITGASGTWAFNPATAGVGGPYNLTWTPPAGSCYVATSTQIAVTAGTNPAATLNSPVTSPCVGSASFNLTASITNGVWSGTNVTSTGTFTPTTPGANVLTYTPPATSCSPSSTITVNVTSGTQVTLTAPTSVCSLDAPVALTASITGGTWSGTGIDASGLFTPADVVGASTTLTYTPPTGSCSAATTTTIQVQSPAETTVTAPAQLCTTASPAILSANIPSGTWSGTGVSGTSFNPSGLASGDYSVTFTPNVGQCYNPSSATITVVTNPDISLTNPGTLCSTGVSVSIPAATNGGTWSGTGIININNGTFSPTTAGAGDWTVTYTTSGVCASSSTTVVHVVGPQSINLTVPSQVCITAANTTFTASVSGGSWTGNGVSTSGVFTPSTPGVGGPYTMTYTLSDVCASNATATVSVIAQPTVTITDLAGPLCSTGNQVTLNANLAGGTWSGNGVNPSTGVFTPASNLAGNNVITYTISGVCSASDNTTVNVVASPAVAITDPSPFCVNALNTTLTASPAGGVWSNGNGILDVNTGAYSPSTAGVGNWNITYTYTTGPCTVSDNTTVSVNGLPNVSAGANVAICNGASTPLQASGASTYQWSINGGAAVGLNNSSIANPTANPTQTTTYTVLGVDGNQCTNTATVIVTVNPLPNVTASADVSICQGETTNLSANGAITYAWSPSTGLTGANTANPTATPSSTQTYTVTGTDANGCTDTDNVVVTVIIPSVAIDNNVVNSGNGLTFTVTSNCTNFAWDYGDNSAVFTTTGSSATHDFTSVPANGSYFVTTVVGSIGSCTAQDTIHVFVDFVQLMYPNIVIVNSQAVNNRTLSFLNPTMYPGVTSIPTIVDFKVEIFNRWGAKVGEITDPLGSWDPKDVEAGAYFYTVSYNKRNAGTNTEPVLIEQSLEILKK